MNDETERERKRLEQTLQPYARALQITSGYPQTLKEIAGLDRLLEQEQALFPSAASGISETLHAAAQAERAWIDSALPPDPGVAHTMAEQMAAARSLIGLDSHAETALASLQSDYALQVSGLREVIDPLFRLPSLQDIDWLRSESQWGAVSGLLGDMSYLQGELERILESIQQPCLQIADAGHSLGAIAELQSIQQAISAGRGFESGFVEALRADLGDWRDAVVWPQGIASDAQLRMELYVHQGLDQALVNFPAAAFEEMLGLTRLDAPVIEIEREDDPASEVSDVVLVADGDPLVRMGHAYQSLFSFERRLRALIDDCMTRLLGSAWPKSRLPNGLYEAWLEKQRKAVAQGHLAGPLIEYADFTDYEKVICRNDNWEQVFKPIFQRKEFVRESMQRLYPARLAIMHARFISQEDQLFLYVEVARLSAAFGVA